CAHIKRVGNQGGLAVKNTSNCFSALGQIVGNKLGFGAKGLAQLACAFRDDVVKATRFGVERHLEHISAGSKIRALFAKAGDELFAAFADNVVQSLKLVIERPGDLSKAAIEVFQGIAACRCDCQASALGGVVECAVDFDDRRLQA